jgi:hypothetical protein
MALYTWAFHFLKHHSMSISVLLCIHRIFLFKLSFLFPMTKEREKKMSKSTGGKKKEFSYSLS